MSMRSWSIPVGRLFGIEIRIHLTFLFLLFFVLSTEGATQDAGAALRVLALVGIVFGSVVLHELGHALVARGSGIPAKGIILLPIGGITILDEAHAIPDSINAWKRDIRIAVAGPLVNLVIAGLSAIVLLAVMPGFSLTARPLLHSSALLRSIVWSNLYLGLFNLLPAYPMDGGRVLRAVFSRRTDMVQATQRAVRIGHVFSIMFMMVGVVSKQKILEALRAEGNGYVQAVMNRIFEVAARQESLASAFRKLSANNLSIIPVVDEQHLVGIVTLQNLMHSMSLLAESRKLRREALDS